MVNMDSQCSSDKQAPPLPGAQLEIAHQRLLAYLKALQIPVRLRYELADRSLARAEAEGAQPDEFIAAAMRNLEAILGETGSRKFHGDLGGIMPMPPLNRGAMLPVSMERSGPLAFLLTIISSAARRLFSPPVRVYFLLVVALALLVLYWYLRGEP